MPGRMLKAISMPLVELTVLLPLLLFWALISFGIWRLPLGVIVVILTLPPLFRYQSMILESCAKGKVPAAFDAEFFSWIGTTWTLFPLPLAVGFVMGGMYAGAEWGDLGTWSTVALAALVFPASLALLAISHSPLEAINPLAIFRLYRGALPTFCIAPLYFLVAIWISTQTGGLPVPVGTFVHLFLFLSFATVTGTLIQPFDLVSNVHIPDALERDAREIAGDIEDVRTLVLGHAYGFISRDNRAGGFKYIVEEIRRDPDPAGAWAWYFDRMLGWENKQHAMFFGQHHVADMLDHGEEIPALKAIMRCRSLDETFRPFPDDIPRAISAAERNGNNELAAVLKRG